MKLGKLILALSLVTACGDEPKESRTVIDHVRPGQRDAGDDEEEPSDDEPPEAKRDASVADARTPMMRDATVVVEDARVSDGEVTRDASAVDAGPPSACANGADLPLARGLRVRELSLYQTVKVPLYRGGSWTTASDVPVVAGKKALVRVFVDTVSGYTPHRVRAVLQLDGAKGMTRLQDEKTLSAASTDAEPQSTFAFTVEGEKIEEDTALTVSLFETACDAMPGRAADVRLPTMGRRDLGATTIGKLKVVVVPIEIGGRLPKTDTAEQTKIRDALLAYFPVASVELKVRSTALRWSGSVGGNDSNAWSSVLNQLLRVRSADGADTDVYYYGLMQPSSTFANFCGRGCILGMAPQTTRVSPNEQAGLSVYFTDRAEVSRTSQETIVHEVGHAHGRGHAPCVQGGTIRGVDGSFPDRSGATGVWGWDSRTDTLMPPTHKDVMGYCDPDWISAYTYAGLAERSLRVNSLTLIHGDVTSTWHRVLLHEDGSAQWGGATLNTQPGGERETARVLDATGREIATTEVVRVTLSHTGEQFLYLQTAPAEWSTLVLSDRTLTLGQIQAAL